MLNKTNEEDIHAEFEIQEALLTDRIFLSFGVEKEEYSRAIVQHKLKDDIAVQLQLEGIDSMIDEDLKVKLSERLCPQEEVSSDRSLMDSYRDDCSQKSVRDDLSNDVSKLTLGNSHYSN